MHGLQENPLALNRWVSSKLFLLLHANEKAAGYMKFNQDNSFSISIMALVRINSFFLITHKLGFENLIKNIVILKISLWKI